MKHYAQPFGLGTGYNWIRAPARASGETATDIMSVKNHFGILMGRGRSEVKWWG